MTPSIDTYERATSNIPVKLVSSHIENVNGTVRVQPEEEHKHDEVLRVFRCLIADLCEQFKGGHPGYV